MFYFVFYFEAIVFKVKKVKCSKYINPLLVSLAIEQNISWFSDLLKHCYSKLEVMFFPGVIKAQLGNGKQVYYRICDKIQPNEFFYYLNNLAQFHSVSPKYFSVYR